MRAMRLARVVVTAFRVRRATSGPTLAMVLVAGLIAALPTGTLAGRPQPPDVTVEVRSISYAPSDITVPRRTRVRWENVTSPSRVHDVVSSIPGFFGSGLYGGGETYSYRFVSGGTFTYICSIHDVMIGAVHVPMGARILNEGEGDFVRVRLAGSKLSADSPFRYMVLQRDPGSSEFVTWRTTRKPYLDFVPTSSGTYDFVMRVETVDGGHSTGPGGDSPVSSLEWPG